MKKLSRIFSVFLLISLLSACTSLFKNETPPERIYLLKPLLVQSTSITNTNLPALSVSVTAVPGLDSNKLLILEPDSHLNHYASARWPDNSTEVFTSLLKKTLESSGRYSRVTTNTTALIVDQALELEITELFTLNDSYKMATDVKMTMQGYVNCSGQEHAISLKASEKVNSNKLSGIVAAYQELVDNVSQQLLDKSFEVCGS